MSKIKVGSIVKFKAPLSLRYRVISISERESYLNDDIVIESTTKTDMLTGKPIITKKGRGVQELVKRWQIVKVEEPKKGLSGESTKLWALSSTPIYSPRDNRY